MLESNFCDDAQGRGMHPNSVEFWIPVMIYPLENYNYKLRIMTISSKLQRKARNYNAKHQYQN